MEEIENYVDEDTLIDDVIRSIGVEFKLVNPFTGEVKQFYSRYEDEETLQQIRKEASDEIKGQPSLQCYFKIYDSGDIEPEFTRKTSNPGFTQIANDILEQVPRYKFSGSQLGIIMVLWRFTYGFHRLDHDLSVGFISEATGIDKREVRDILKKLIQKQVIVVTKESTPKSSRRISFNRQFLQWAIARWGENVPHPEGDLSLTERGDFPPKK